MRIIIVMFLIFSLVHLPLGLSQDNAMYGDYLIASTQKIISLDLEGAKLVDVLKMLSQQTSLNFISTEAVKERLITLYLEKVPLKEALDVVFKANNLTYDYYPEGNMFVVKEMGRPTIELKTKVYHLKYVRIRSSRMQKEIKEKMETTAGTLGLQTTGSDTTSTSTTSTSGSSASTQEKDLGLKNAIKNVLTEFGKVNEDPITNSIIVVDVPSQFAVIDEMIANLDIPTPKVMIEVEMLDVQKTLVDKLGFKYGADSSYNGDFTTTFTGPSRQTAFPLGDYRHAVSSPTFTYGNLAMGSLTAVMQFLAQDTTTKILARPKILTLSNETAEVNITTDEAIGVTTTLSQSGDAQTQTIERAETGTKLRVTPQINPDTKEVTLFVEVFTKEATEGSFGVSGMTGGGKVMNPEERATRTTLRLKDGETLLIGGLIKKKDTNTKQKVPFLGDLPFIGSAFRYKSDQDIDRELLVFLTPRIIEDSPALKTAEKKLIPREQYFSRKDSIDVALDKFSNY
jgi:type IV pilus assembly protein PilQ